MSLLLRVLLFTSLFGLINASAVFAEGAKDCCGRSANIVFNIDLAQKKLTHLKTLFFDERICKPLEPVNFGNAYFIVSAGSKETLKMKIQLPSERFFDSLGSKGKIAGGVQTLSKFPATFKIPDCVKIPGSQIKIENLKGDLLAAGDA